MCSNSILKRIQVLHIFLILNASTAPDIAHDQSSCWSSICEWCVLILCAYPFLRNVLTDFRLFAVDVSTPKGIEEAASLGLAISGLADIISSPFIYETTTLFQETPAAGKCFTLLRHPVDRAISQYHFYQKEDSVTPNNKQYQGMTIDEFAEAVAENNWMVRFLTGKRSGTLSWHDLEAAKEGTLIWNLTRRRMYHSNLTSSLHDSVWTKMPCWSI
jgi:hypothetical protein